MQFGRCAFGAVEIDGARYTHDVIIDRGHIRKRKKNASKPFRALYGHTPLTAMEDIPWACQWLVVGTGAYGSLPIHEDMHSAARLRNVELVLATTPSALELLVQAGKGTNAVLHVTC